MPTYDLVWNRTRPRWSKHSEWAPWIIEAILHKRVLLDGKPQMRVVIGRLGAIEEEPINEAAFWRAVRHRAGLASARPA